MRRSKKRRAPLTASPCVLAGSPEPLLRGLMRFDRPWFYFLSQREKGHLIVPYAALTAAAVSRVLGARCICDDGCLHAEHCADEERRVDAEPGGDGGKETGDAEVEPVDRDEPASGARDHARRIGIHRRDAAAESQGDVEKSEAQ